MAAIAQVAVTAGLPSVTDALDWSAGTGAGGAGRVDEVATGHLVASEGAFVVGAEHRSALQGRGVVLLDDSYTTGATAQSAAQALRRAGVATVVVLVLARAVRPGRSATQRAYWQLVRAGRDRTVRGPAGPRAPCAAGRSCRWADAGG
jgi:hypothetical protein